MSEPIPPVKTTALTKRQARELEKSDFIRYLREADLSDARRYFDLAKFTTRQHDKNELIAGATVGILVGALIGGGSWLMTTLTGRGIVDYAPSDLSHSLDTRSERFFQVGARRSEVN